MIEKYRGWIIGFAASGAVVVVVIEPGIGFVRHVGAASLLVIMVAARK